MLQKKSVLMIKKFWQRLKRIYVLFAWHFSLFICLNFKPILQTAVEGSCSFNFYINTYYYIVLNFFCTIPNCTCKDFVTVICITISIINIVDYLLKNMSHDHRQLSFFPRFNMPIPPTSARRLNVKVNFNLCIKVILLHGEK